MSEFQKQASEIIRSFDRMIESDQYEEEEAYSAMHSQIVEALKKAEELGFDSGVADLMQSINNKQSQDLLVAYLSEISRRSIGSVMKDENLYILAEEITHGIINQRRDTS